MCSTSSCAAAAARSRNCAPQIELLRKIGDTLGVLGLGELRAPGAGSQRAPRGAWWRAARAPTKSTLVQVAASLIQVEDHLDGAAGRPDPAEARRRQAAAPKSADQDFEQVQGAVLRECVVNLARVKESIAQNVSGTLDAAGFDSWLELMRGIKAGLLMLGKSRAVEVIDAITEQLRRVMQPGGMPLSGCLPGSAGRCDRQPRVLHRDAAGRSQRSVVHARQRAGVPGGPGARARAGRAHRARGQPGATTRAPCASAPPPQAVLADAADPESTSHALTPPVLHGGAAPQCFGQRSGTAEPVCRRSARGDGKDSRATIRSGTRIRWRPRRSASCAARSTRSRAAAAWSARANSASSPGRSKTCSTGCSTARWHARPRFSSTLREAVGLLPQLVAELGEGATLAHAAGAAGGARARARRRTRGPRHAGRRPAPEAPHRACAAGSRAGSAPQRPSRARARGRRTGHLRRRRTAEAAIAGGDAALREIYARETSSHVLTVRAWLAREQPHPAPHVLTEEVYRACHTLSGSSRMAEARHGTRLAEPLNHWLRKSFDSGVGLDDSDLLLLADCMTAMATVADHLDEDTGLLRGARHAARAHCARRARTRSAHCRSDRAQRAHRPARAARPCRRCASPSRRQRRRPRQPARRRIDFDPEIAAIFSEEASELLEAVAVGAAGLECGARGRRRSARRAQAFAAHLQGRSAHGRRRRHGRPVA